MTSANMASDSGEGMSYIEDAPASFKSGVWEHFGFPITYDDAGKKLI